MPVRLNMYISFDARNDAYLLTACTATLCVAFHDGPVVDILPSPHISNAVLSIGGHIWAIWKSLDLVHLKSRSFYSVCLMIVKHTGRTRA